MVGRTAVNLLIVHVVEAEGYDLVLSGQELELVAAQAEFGALVVGGAETMVCTMDVFPDRSSTLSFRAACR